MSIDLDYWKNYPKFENIIDSEYNYITKENLYSHEKDDLFARVNAGTFFLLR